MESKFQIYKNLCIDGATGYLAANFLNSSYVFLRNLYSSIFLFDRTLKLDRLDKDLLKDKKIKLFSVDIVSDDINLDEIFAIRNSNLDFIRFAHFSSLENEFRYLELLKKYSIDFKLNLSLFFLSSAAVYGEQNIFPIKEDSPLKPISDYGLHKKKVEEYIRDHFQTYLILRLSNPFGKEFSVKGAYAFFLNNLRKQIRDKKKKPYEISLNSNHKKEIVRDMLYIDDFCEYLRIILSSWEPQSQDIVNISSSKETYLEDLALKALESVSEENELNLSETDINFLYKGLKSGDIKKSVLDNTKLMGFIKNHTTS